LAERGGFEPSSSFNSCRLAGCASSQSGVGLKALSAWRRRLSSSGSARSGVVRLQDSATGREGSEDAVGDAAGLHRCQEFIDDFVPTSGGHQRVGLVVGDDLHVTLAERHEKQDSVRLLWICHGMCVEFATLELPSVSVLDALRYDPEPDRKPFKPAWPQKTGAALKMRPARLAPTDPRP